ncbi:hypothetical protein CP10139811_0541 [Chlamydia ibidis]|uniref:Uncharacterized protein n=2 Tax=Chlamydia ibidis TaxID=1405396 RepID=S7J2X2_9CHLA|nr:hypothetical protein [Chlamydia ibidis]EPP34588.1 hypothetical protein CP10139811_0541 [Chlamydia ibidis]EQM62489.1 hypothetical protein H359_0921 [Chlamydia ibidis 10-1398/6]
MRIIASLICAFFTFSSFISRADANAVPAVLTSHTDELGYRVFDDYTLGLSFAQDKEVPLIIVLVSGERNDELSELSRLGFCENDGLGTLLSEVACLVILQPDECGNLPDLESLKATFPGQDLECEGEGVHLLTIMLTENGTPELLDRMTFDI